MNIIEKDIDKQISHIMANYGDQPDELFYKLRCLVMEWFLRGTAVKIHNATGDGMKIQCNHCGGELTVHHLEWEAITCLHCGGEVKRVRPA
jgi:ribosomal protein S27E